jgi:trans-aconitate methyltransferase
VGSEQSAEYYQLNHRSLAPLDQSPWRDVYELVAQMVPPGEAIADLGCGTGRFARLMADRGHRGYWGVDFSPERVEEARRYVPEYDFMVGDLYDPGIQGRFSDFRSFVLTEVLEHLEADLDVLEAIPAAASLVLSVPNYDSQGHARFFRSAAEVTRHFGGMLRIEEITELQRPRPGRLIWVARALRR